VLTTWAGSSQSATSKSSVALRALVLAAMGLFGVVAGSVTKRRQELAIRLAIGADQWSLLRFVLLEAVLLVGIRSLLPDLSKYPPSFAARFLSKHTCRSPQLDTGL
jgi:ABC-type antimicrobial peptide transport system permease subunit